MRSAETTMSRSRTAGNVVDLLAYKRTVRPVAPPRVPEGKRLARLYVAEDGCGDVDCGMEGVSALNALALLGPLLYLSTRLLDVYTG